MPHKHCGFQNYSKLGTATSQICCWLWNNGRDNKYIKLGISWWKMKEILWIQLASSANPLCAHHDQCLAFPLRYSDSISYSAVLFWWQRVSSSGVGKRGAERHSWEGPWCRGVSLGEEIMGLFAQNWLQLLEELEQQQPWPCYINPECSHDLGK